ncbi:MAG: hypothetical protein PHP44_14160 [Kiritimatiellae bacterium]|nr:hypothetical protein [Kiritimatiellia bacterium]
MKKIMSLALTGLLAATVAHAASNEVYSVNVVGFSKVDAPVGLSIMAMPFDAEASTIDDVVGTNGVYGNSSTIADNVMIYDELSQSFKIFWLRSLSAFGGPIWFSAAGPATNEYLYPGMSFWYQSRAASDWTNTMVGDVVPDAAVTNVIVPGLQLMSYPYSTDVVMTDMNLTNGVYGNSSTIADNIMLYDSENESFRIFWLRSLSAFGGPIWFSASGPATNVVIKMGEGFWYQSRAASNMNWVEPCPYDLSAE